MRILRVQTVCSSADEVEEFYRERMGLVTSRDRDAVRVAAGATELELVEDARARPGSQHYAFTITSDAFADAKSWLRERTDLLRGADGEDEFDYPAWNARSMYFDGPDGSVLEFIVRRDLETRYRGGFGPDDILCVSEVGLPVADIPALQEELAGYGIAPYGPGGGPFRPLGDPRGLLIVVAPDRPWVPTERTARAQPLVVTVEAERTGEVAAGEAATVRLVTAR